MGHPGLSSSGASLSIPPSTAGTEAGDQTPSDRPIRYLTGDVFELPAALQPDVVISALFAHHLDDSRLVRFLG